MCCLLYTSDIKPRSDQGLQLCCKRLAYKTPGPPGWGLGVVLAAPPRKKTFPMYLPHEPWSIDGFNGNGPGTIQWTRRKKNNIVNAATWNVRTTLQPGKIVETASEM